MSFTYNKNKNDPGIDPCGTPHGIEYVFFYLFLLKDINCCRR